MVSEPEKTASGTSSSRKDKKSEVNATPPLRLPDLLRGPFDIRSLALTGLFVLAIFYTIYFMRAVLFPLVLALLLSYLLRPIVRELGTRLRIPAAFSAAIILLSLIGAIVYAVSVLAPSAAGWLEKAPYSLQQIQRKLMPLKQPIESVARASGEIEKLASPNNPETKTAIELKRHPLTDVLYVQTPELIVSTAMLLILLYFLLAYDGVFLPRLIKLLPTLSDKKRAVLIASDIEAQISRYLLTVTIINICLGIAVGTTVGFLGLRNPIMWGTRCGLELYPLFGAFTGIICMTLGAVLSFDSLGYALLFRQPICSAQRWREISSLPG
jgi:predicted PurR-regulated permease PerM